MIHLECPTCGRAVAFAGHPHPATCLCGGRYVDAGHSLAGRLRRERDEARRERDIALRRLAAVTGTAQRLAREGRAEVLAAELPEGWR